VMSTTAVLYVGALVSAGKGENILPEAFISVAYFISLAYYWRVAGTVRQAAKRSELVSGRHIHRFLQRQGRSISSGIMAISAVSLVRSVLAVDDVATHLFALRELEFILCALTAFHIGSFMRESFSETSTLSSHSPNQVVQNPTKVTGTGFQTGQLTGRTSASVWVPTRGGGAGDASLFAGNSGSLVRSPGVDDESEQYRNVVSLALDQLLNASPKAPAGEQFPWSSFKTSVKVGDTVQIEAKPSESSGTKRTNSHSQSLTHSGQIRRAEFVPLGR